MSGGWGWGWGWGGAGGGRRRGVGVEKAEKEEKGGEERSLGEIIVAFFIVASWLNGFTLSTISFSCCCWMSFCCASALRWASGTREDEGGGVVNDELKSKWFLKRSIVLSSNPLPSSPHPPAAASSSRPRGGTPPS